MIGIVACRVVALRIVAASFLEDVGGTTRDFGNPGFDDPLQDRIIQSVDDDIDYARVIGDG